MKDNVIKEMDRKSITKIGVFYVFFIRSADFVLIYRE